MTDRDVLSMPSKRFWLMERQIDRIQSAKDLREINIQRSTNSKESMQEVVDHLVLQIGETTKVEINPFVLPEPGFREKLQKAASVDGTK